MYIKGFDKDLKCRGYQFEIGKEYKIENNGKPLELCSDAVFHFCDSLQKVDVFYDCSNKANRYCIIEPLGKIIKSDDRCGSNHIKIVREIFGEELNILKGLVNGNSGLFNSGYGNSGNWNSGYGNSGYGNSCDYSNGVFCNEQDMNIRIFNQPSGMSLGDFYNSKYYDAIISKPFLLTELIEYTQEEKEQDKDKKLIGYWLKTYTYKEASVNWWNKLTKENQEIIKSIPNFDADIFYDITGIRVQ